LSASARCDNDVHAAPPVPVGWRVVPNRSLAVHDQGCVLVGGSPIRVLRLTADGARVVRHWFAGGAVGAAMSERRLARRLLDAGLAHPAPSPRPLKADVTIVIPARDRPDHLRACLDGCAGFNVTIVDDASDDAAGIRALGVQYGASIVRRDVNGGPAAARNLGVRSAASPFVAFVDSDCRLHVGWLERLLAHFEDPAVGAVAPRIRPARRARRSKGRVLAQYEEARSPLDMGSEPAFARLRSRVPYVPAAALVVRRTAMPPFDEALRWGEDVDLVWRMTEHGWRVVYDPATEVEHSVPADVATWLGKRVRYNAAAAPLELRHPGSIRAVDMSGWSAMSLVLLASRRPLAAAGVAVFSTGVLEKRLQPFVGSSAQIAAGIVGAGFICGVTATAQATRRAWWPIALAAAVRSRRARYVTLGAIAVAARQRPRGTRIGVVPWVFLTIVDDFAAGLGVWLGCVRHRTVRPLLPRFRFSTASVRSAPSGQRRHPRRSTSRSTTPAGS
jgi:mycofactocin system glycosyltransferase